MADFINTFDKTRLVKVIALYEWICHVNNKPSLRYPAFNDPAENAIAYTAPNDDFLTQASMKSLQLEHNAPNLADFMDLMLFIEAVNSEDAEFPELSENDKEFYEVYAKQPNKSLFQVFYKPTNVEPAEIKANDRHPLANGMLNAIKSLFQVFYKPTTVEPAEIKANGRHQLANGMLNAITRFRERSFASIEEQINSNASDVSPADEKQYRIFSSMHAHALDRIGSGKSYNDKGEGSFSRSGFVLLRALLVLPLYPFFVVAGGVVSLFINTLNREEDGEDHTSRVYALFSGIKYSIGDAGSKYWAQAGLDMPGFLPGDSGLNHIGRFCHSVLGAISIALTSVVEFGVKSFTWPFKFIVGYDRLAVDSYLRQGINGFENLCIGLLSSPMIVFNNLYRGVLDLMPKTFSRPENDPDLKMVSDWLGKHTIFGLDLKDPSLKDMVFIFFFKSFRLIFDTIPSVLTQTVIGSLRSILPAMPGTTQEFRDTAFKWMSRALYTTLFTMTALFLTGAFIAGIGGTVPAWLGVIFGYDPTVGSGAGKFASAYGDQIFGAIKSITSGISTVFSTPAQSIANFFVTYLNPANIGSLFTQGGLMGRGGPISVAFSSIGTKAEVIGTVIGSILGGAVTYFIGGKSWEYYKKKSLEEDLKKELIVPTDSHADVKLKLDKSGVAQPTPSNLVLYNPKLHMKTKVEEKKTENETNPTNQVKNNNKEKENHKNNSQVRLN